MWLHTPSYGGGGGEVGGSYSFGGEAKKARAVMGRPRKNAFLSGPRASAQRSRFQAEFTNSMGSESNSTTTAA
eukprot:247773-Pleurochrysis_carterae.AAC.1